MSLLEELAKIKQEYDEYATSVAPPWHIRRLRSAEVHAQYLLKSEAAGAPTTREYMVETQKMTESDWAWAMGLLRSAELAYRYGEDGDGIKPIENISMLKAKIASLAEHRERLERLPDPALHTLTQYMPRRYRK